ncbi:hypothetical protein DFR58_1226 [Anaerobacterium chartisolvens]|uniref:DUF4179 domain-containing protein n=1 Tax=Anaerobacterium chartisolvens TaxID=1297424 RepID=A0A369ASI3_9FIRM|nr:DUF4179 domain-containing protein [Anaerobacterium chartisolvens]RCX12320.1 hypothetical protein DFR58_1226 [Anaerobacterium chartisolvens]
MNKDKYKAAVDSVKFRESFEQDTIELMRRAAEYKTQKKENDKMKTRKIIKVSVITAALIAALTGTAFALSALLSPPEVALKAGNNALASAFESKDSITINQSRKAGDYTITLNGIVSGKGLTEYDKEAEADKSYIVASIAHTDESKINEAGETGISFSPLISGYKPWQVNAWTLGGGYSSFIHDGVNYYIFECKNLEIFADRTVYLAAYEGTAPSADIFTISQNGDISFAEGFTKPHAMFTLPLDPQKADPGAASKLLESTGIITD